MRACLKDVRKNLAGVKSLAGRVATLGQKRSRLGRQHRNLIKKPLVSGRVLNRSPITVGLQNQEILNQVPTTGSRGNSVLAARACSMFTEVLRYVCSLKSGMHVAGVIRFSRCHVQATGCRVRSGFAVVEPCEGT